MKIQLTIFLCLISPTLVAESLDKPVVSIEYIQSLLHSEQPRKRSPGRSSFRSPKVSSIPSPSISSPSISNPARSTRQNSLISSGTYSVKDIGDDIRDVMKRRNGQMEKQASRRAAKKRSPMDQMKSQYTDLKSSSDKKGNYRQLMGHFLKGDNSLDVLSRHEDFFGVSSINETLSAGRIISDDKFGRVKKYQRYYKGIEVWGSEINALEAKDKIAFSGQFTALNQDIDLTHMLEESVLVKIALTEVNKKGRGLKDYSSEAVIHTIGGRTEKFYKITLLLSNYDEWIVFIDPRTSRVVHRFNNKQSAQEEGSGVDLLGVNQNFSVFEEDGLYYLYNALVPNSSESVIYDFQNGETFSDSTFITSNSPITGFDPAGISAYVNQSVTFDYFKNTFGRNSIDDKGMALTAVVHFDQNLNNAFWSNKAMFFGDGDGELFSNLAGCLDITAHEMTHGVVENTAGLIYQNQSGALNESFADVFAVMVDRDDWFLGEDCFLTAPGYLRNIQNPNLGFGGGQPAHMSDFLQVPTSQDHGGVHTNSGIPNRVAYLMAEGLSDEGLGQSIGREKTEQIFYRALLMLTANADFFDARVASEAATEMLYGEGSSETVSVAAAWDAVGILESDAPASSGGETRIENTAGQDVLVYLYPKDGTHDNPFSPAERYDIYLQTLTNPFLGYDQSLDFGPINSLGEPKYSRPAYFGEDGVIYITYVGIDGNLYIIDEIGEARLTQEGGFNSVVISQDGNTIVLTRDDSPDIIILDLVKESTEVIRILGPDYTSEGLDTSFVNRVDSVSFNYTGKKLIFDFASCVPSFEDSCEGESAPEFWSVGIYDLDSKQFSYPFPSQNADVDLGFPKFSNTTDRYIVFDLVDYTNLETDTQAESLILMYDTEEQLFQTVGTSNLGETREFTFGLPSFSGDDDYIVFQVLTDTDGKVARLDVAENFQVDQNSFEILNDFDVALPYVQRDQLRRISRQLVTDRSDIDFGTLRGEVSTIISLSNQGNGDLEITNIIRSSSRISHNLTNRILSPNESVEFTVSAEFISEAPILAESLSIEHTGTNPAVIIEIVGLFDGDFDGDGSNDSVDNDDDNDGTPDNEDQFPQDSSETKDTDSDGIGNNEDTDDDNDGIPDSDDELPEDESNNPLLLNRLENLSTRGFVGRGERVLIGGLVISGNERKTVLIRASGPALRDAGVNGVIEDPKIDLLSGTTLIASNDDWQNHANAQQVPIQLQPSDTLESAIVITLDPGAYTAIVSGFNGGEGIGLVEVFELSDTRLTRLQNIATRGFIGTGDQVLIGGLIISGQESKKVVIRAKGPSLIDAGVSNVIADPEMFLFSGADRIDENNDWQNHQNMDDIPIELRPNNDKEAVISRELPPGAYTVIVSGVAGTAGIGIIEVFEIQ
jgi:bacillolysin